MTHMLSLLPKSRFEESGVEIPGGLAFLADYRPDAIAEAAAGTEGLFMPPSHPRLDADLLARLGSVRIIQTAGAGFDSVDHAAAAKLGLIVCNSPAQNAITVAEHVIGAVICLQRELAYADEAIKSGAYAQARERILDRGACELFGATVGIVGLGGIGRALAPRLAAFGATVVALRRRSGPRICAQEHGIRRVNLDELFAVSDIVTLHCPLMDATRGLVDAARLASMKPGAILVNEYMQTSDPDIYAGGDCVAIPNLITGKPFVLALGSLANRQGRVIGTMFTTIGLLALLLTVVGLLFHTPMLTAMNTPAESMTEAVHYLVVCSGGMIFIYGYNAVCAVLRGMGDSTHPLLFVAIATAVNVVLDLLFVAVFHWDAMGAALATVIGQAAAFLFAIFFLYRRRASFVFDFKPSSFAIQSRELKVFLKLGLPITLQSNAVTFSMLFISSRANSFGLVPPPSTAWGRSFTAWSASSSSSVQASAASVVGQNMGAGRLDRVKQSVYWPGAGT